MLLSEPPLRASFMAWRRDADSIKSVVAPSTSVEASPSPVHPQLPSRPSTSTPAFHCAVVFRPPLPTGGNLIFVLGCAAPCAHRAEGVGRGVRSPQHLRGGGARRALHERRVQGLPHLPVDAQFAPKAVGGCACRRASSEEPQGAHSRPPHSLWIPHAATPPPPP